MFKNLSSREKTLIVVLVIAVILVLWYIAGGDELATPTGVDVAGTSNLQAPVVRMDLLSGAAEDYDVNGRDLFKYSKRPPTAEELERERLRREADAKRREEAADRKRQAQERRRNAPKPKAPTGPRPPILKLKYLGNIGPKEDRHAVFADGDAVLLARVGEVVQEDFKVVNIEYQTVVMGYTDSRFEDRTESLTMANK